MEIRRENALRHCLNIVHVGVAGLLHRNEALTVSICMQTDKSKSLFCAKLGACFPRKKKSPGTVPCSLVSRFNHVGQDKMAELRGFNVHGTDKDHCSTIEASHLAISVWKSSPAPKTGGKYVPQSVPVISGRNFFPPFGFLA